MSDQMEISRVAEAESHERHTEEPARLGDPCFRGSQNAVAWAERVARAAMSRDERQRAWAVQGLAQMGTSCWPRLRPSGPDRRDQPGGDFSESPPPRFYTIAGMRPRGRASKREGKG